jgi:hypothetical protein
VLQRVERANRHPDAVFECLTLLLAVLRAALRDRGDLLTENLLLRHQLAVLTRPTRRRPRLRPRDKLLWVLARRLRRDWQRLWGAQTRLGAVAGQAASG